MYTHLCITYDHPTDPLTLKYRLRDNSVVPKWVDKMLLAQQYPIDDPGRFYGFGTLAEESNLAVNRINDCIDIINNHKTIIHRRVTDIYDTDILNYLHHIFEVYHGLLDQQSKDFYVAAPQAVKQALADLNICVHRCEAVVKGIAPRHVVTYYGLPKTDKLENEDYNFFTDVFDAGSIYLNYVEIGKTFEDLTLDRDRYISEQAFKPFRYYSADFMVVFQTSSTQVVAERRRQMDAYYKQNSKFFLAQGLGPSHPYLKAGRIPLADIDNPPNNIVQLLSTRQSVKSVILI